MAAPVAEAGLIVDIAGAWALAMGLTVKDAASVALETASFYGGNPYLARSAAAQRADAQVGAVLLSLGFFGQFASSVGWEPRWATSALMVGLAMAIAIVAYVFLFRLWRPLTIARVEAERQRLESDSRVQS